MTTVRVRLFARARDLAGAEAVELDLPAGATVADLRARLAECVPALAGLLSRAAVAVNEDFTGDDTVIPPKAEVALIPPVSGGSDIRDPVIWEGEVVGWMENRRVDMWYHYGRWIPENTPATERFLEAIRTRDEARVLLGTDKGVVNALPEEGTIDVKIVPGSDW